MEEVKINSYGVGGYTEDVDFPRSDIYISSKQGDEKKLYTFRTKEGSFHFFLVFNPGTHFTQEEVKDCKGDRLCFNCSQPIVGPIYFYPTEYTKLEEIICSPIPHCRPACALRSVTDIKNNFDLLSNFFLMYGPDISCAPPRMLLYVPGGLTIAQYHSMINDGLIVHEECQIVRSFLAPVYMSCTFLQGHQLVTDVVSLIEEMRIESKTSVGPSRSRDNSKLNVMELPTKDLFNTVLADTFSVDPSSSRRPTTSKYFDKDEVL